MYGNLPPELMTITLDHLYSKLLEVEQKLSRQKLGFQSGDRALKYVFVQLTNGNKDGWYELVGEKPNQRAITLPSVYWGTVQNIDFKTVSRRGESNKFRLWMHSEDADGTNPELVMFESGESTFFARTVLAAMSKLSPDQLKRPIRLGSYIKDIEQGANAGDRTLAVNLSFGDGDHNRIDSQWKASDDWQSISRQAIANVRAASGYVPKEEREARGDSYSQPQQAPPPKPAQPTFNAPPAPPPIMHQPKASTMSRKDILAKINTDHLHMDDTDKTIVFPLAMSAIGKGIGSKPDELTEQEFALLVDELLMAWADSLKIGEGIPQSIYPDKSREAFAQAMNLYNNPADPWKRAQCWAVMVDIERKKMEDQQSLDLTPSYDSTPF